MILRDYKIYRQKTSSYWPNQRQSIGKIKVKILVLIALTITVLFATQIVFAASLATDGQKLSEIEQQIKSLEAENTTLKVEIAKESSLVTLSKKASQLGFIKPSTVIAP